MKYTTAVKVIEKECEFLGKDFDEVMFLVCDNPGMFPQRALDAYEVIYAEHDPDPGAFSDREAFYQS